MNLHPNPIIIKQFPGERQKIIALCANDKLVNELCEDYEKVINALSDAVIEIHDEQELNTSSFHHLVHLKKELEKELQERLSKS